MVVKLKAILPPEGGASSKEAGGRDGEADGCRRMSRR